MARNTNARGHARSPLGPGESEDGANNRGNGQIRRQSQCAESVHSGRQTMLRKTVPKLPRKMLAAAPSPKVIDSCAVKENRSGCSRKSNPQCTSRTAAPPFEWCDLIGA